MREFTAGSGQQRRQGAAAAIRQAERTGNWELHLLSVSAMVPYFFAMDSQITCTGSLCT